MQNERYIDTKTLAEMTSIPAKSWVNMRHLGVGPAYVKMGRRVIYSVDDVNSWLEARKQSPASPEPVEAEATSGGNHG